ncbi:E3 ubiquitin-protein ligase TRIM71 [Geodia barretti]|uniref:E3 ubiquitin-protein ligase TRIM71 n=1 Tax=Geodia barretti TaxID=519541 RepID=A0AA35WI99_GEOBA|nr:E3 ubiquitin-protein ligase TRIM71 [Geodia barretti]
MQEEKFQSSQKEQEKVKQFLKAEVTRAEEVISRKQQQIQELKQQETELLQVKERELAEARQKLRQKDKHLQFSEALVADLRLQLAKYFDSYACKVSGPGLSAATVNNPTHVLVELTDSGGKPYSTSQLSITAELEHLPKVKYAVRPATPATGAKRLKLKQLPAGKCLSVTTISPSQYKVLYTAVSQGQHKLHVCINDREIKGSPFTLTAYIDPTQLERPVTVVNNLSGPCGIAFNSRDEMIVSECSAHRLSIFDSRGKPITTFGSHGERPDDMIAPAGIALDDADNIYVSSEHKLQKFTSSGELIKCIGRKGNKEGEFDDPRGVTVYNSHAYVCDRNNHRIQVFDVDISFVRSIGSYGKQTRQFNAPLDVQFDATGNMYVSELGNKRVQVFDGIGRAIRIIGQEGVKLRAPSGLHVADKYVYVSDSSSHWIVVYETNGQFVTSFGSYGLGDGYFDSPYGITSCLNGHIYVCDCDNDRVQIF